MTTKLFFDTEFTGLHQKTTLISIGIIAESGETFYAEFTDYDKTQVDDWIKDNVIANLQMIDKIKVSNSSWECWESDNGHYDNALEFTLAKKDMKNFKCIGATPMIKNRLEKWLAQFESVQIWSDCLAYDWVLFCQIFGHAFSIPKNIYYIPFDICPLLLLEENNADISREEYATNTFWQNADGTKTPAFFDEKANKIEPLKHNALWDAMIIRACYFKLVSKRVLAKNI